MAARRHRQSFNVPGHAHELTFSCYGRYPFLERERCRVWLADAVAAARVELDFDVWAYVVMPEHAHVIVRPRREVYEIADVLQAIKEPVGRQAMSWLQTSMPEWLPKLTVSTRNRERRYFWLPGGGYDRNAVEPKTLLSMIDYIHENPVRRGLVERVEQWKWSSATWYFCQRQPPIPLDPIPPEWMITE